jgi:hypothetical protein
LNFNLKQGYYLKEGRKAELVARKTYDHLEVQITMPTNVSLESRLFELMTQEKYQIIHLFHIGSVLPLPAQVTQVTLQIDKKETGKV